MIESPHIFIQLVFTGLIALFPVFNPLGTAFIVSPYFSGLTTRERRIMIIRIAFYSFLLCTVTLFAGHWVLDLFGITVPVIQLAGGIMICKMGWESLSSKADANADSNPIPDAIKDLSSKIFYPITFPITAGAGTISVVFTLSAQTASTHYSQYLINTAAILLAILLMCVLIYICYFNANRLVKYMGSNNEHIVNRLMAFLIFCVGLQIAVSGIFHLIKAYS